MSYRPEEYEEVKIGEKEETEIADIQEGMAFELQRAEYWEKFEGSETEKALAKKRPCIKVITKNGSSAIYNLPDGKKIKPKMRIAMFKKTYGAYPKIGMKVVTKIDENGYSKIVLET